MVGAAVATVDKNMSREVFRKERLVLEGARAAMLRSDEDGVSVAPVLAGLVDEYGRLLRQSRRLVTMGDRMQQSLNALNHDLAVSEQKYRGIFENVAEGICRCDADGMLVEANPAMAEMFGFYDSESFLEAVPDFQSLFCRAEDYELYETLLAADQLRRFQVRLCSPESGRLWAEVSASVMDDREAFPGGIVCVLADVTERKHMIEEMRRLARTDSLTGLYNRGHFMELTERELARSRRTRSPLSMLIVDVDHFKNVNDTYGHDVGDKALVTLSRVLRDAVREIDVVGRFGGEEFVVLLPDADRRNACRVADRILECVREARIDIGGKQVGVTVSIGLTACEDDEEDLDRLIKYADIALYAAKKNGRDRVEVYRRSGCHCRREADCMEAMAVRGES
ncbi:GGDEF domain-containing protein [Pseudodesulfovibrio senegalensis]|uniref:GGDEF domain-containing protein n=2 Tax=Pseudodesulfovibrio senegalensis TaxID=1721087 RepID=A0A6N6N3B1_9BACT|nr:GGDEF domain-containing protein [Pseudodesulfovibrio senegalensis]